MLSPTWAGTDGDPAGTREMTRAMRAYTGRWAAALIAAALAAGCAAPPPQLVARSGTVSVSRVNYRGWRDSYRMTNGDVEVVVVPQIARIMGYAAAGGQNVLWFNDALPRRRIGRTPPADYPNYGGHKLWVAPQDAWTWPPHLELDRGACTVQVRVDGSLRMIGTPSPEAGVRFDREIRLAPTGTGVEVKQIMVNVSDGPVRWAIWDVTQASTGGVGFVPLGQGARWRTGDGAPLSDQWGRVGDVLLLRAAGTTEKVFISGPPGCLGCAQGGWVFLKTFDVAPEPPPDPETPREVWVGTGGFMELEIVGPAVELEPGESATLAETWRLLRAGPEAETDEGLARLLAEHAGPTPP